MKSFDYTISSTDSSHNNMIHTNLAHVQTEYCKMTITSLTTMANIVVLSKDDYIVINNTKYTCDDDYSDISASSLTEYMNHLISTNPNGDGDVYDFFCDHCNRIYITSNRDFALQDCSYNLRLLLGLTNVQLPIESTGANGSHKMTFPDVGMFLSTPVLYLASNLGSNSYKNVSGSTTSMRILMRITNSFFAKQPIVAVNGDYTTTVRSSDLSDVRFTLVDANYHDIKLLSPMYLTVQIEAIPDKLDHEHDLSKGPIDPFSVLRMSQYAYMHDLTERGVDVNESQLDSVIYFDEPQLDKQQQQQLMTPDPNTNDKALDERT